MFRETNLQLRAEPYNTFNHTNYTGFQTQSGISDCGQITGTGSPRIMQFGAKVNC